MANVIRLGDPTSHGDKVVSTAADWFTVDGLPVAYAGHKTSCGATLISTCDGFSNG